MGRARSVDIAGERERIVKTLASLFADLCRKVDWMRSPISETQAAERHLAQRRVLLERMRRLRRLERNRAAYDAKHAASAELRKAMAAE